VGLNFKLIVHSKRFFHQGLLYILLSLSTMGSIGTDGATYGEYTYENLDRELPSLELVGSLPPILPGD
jgi:hypothetical protein